MEAPAPALARLHSSDQSLKTDSMEESASRVASLLSEHRPNVLSLKGEIDLHVSAVVTESLNAMTEKQLEPIVIDLSRATYIDSAGVAALMLAKQEVEAYGGKFFLCGVQETIRLILETSRLDRIFWIFTDVDAALAAHGEWFT